MKLFVVVAVVCLVCVHGRTEATKTRGQEQTDVEGSWWSGFKSGTERNTRSGFKASAGSSRPKVTPCATDRLICQNFDSDVVKLLNQQINEELKASYIYQSMAFYFGRDDISMRGFNRYFQKMSDEERGHAQMFMNYLNQRGGQILFMDIPKPVKDEWGTGLQALKEALKTERYVNNKILDLHWAAQQANDAHLQDFIEGIFLPEQVDSAKEISDYISVLERVKGSPIGEFMFDQQLYEDRR